MHEAPPPIYWGPAGVSPWVTANTLRVRNFIPGQWIDRPIGRIRARPDSARRHISFCARWISPRVESASAVP